MDTTSHDLTGPNVACAISVNRFEEPSKLLVIGESDFDKHLRNEEAFLRNAGVIPSGQSFNGFIDETDPAAAPAAPSKAQACLYSHVTSGPCKCTFRKKCFVVALPPPGPGIPTGPLPPQPIDDLAATCGGGASTFLLEIDHSVEVLMSPRALNMLLLAPSKLCDVVDLMGLPINDVMAPIHDLSSLEQDNWHVSEWLHIVEGVCKCKYLPSEFSKVRPSGAIASRLAT